MMPSWTRKTATTITGDVWALKEFCHVSHALEDATFVLWFDAAIGYLETFTGRGLLTSTYQISLPALPTSLSLPFAAPLASVTHVKYYDADNALQTWASSNYITPSFHEPATLDVLPTATWPSVYDRADAWQIEYIVGWTSVEAMPIPLQLAARMLVAHWNEHREATLVGAVSKELEFAVSALVTPYRVWWVPPC